MKPHVTVLTSVYNGLPYLSEAIESVLNQTYTDFEFLIIDDASTDGSLDCINSFKDPRIRVLKNEHNIGQVPSLRKGLQLAKGNLIARFDQDDVNLPNRLVEQIKYLEEHSDVSIICSWEHSINSKGRRLREWKSVLNNYGDFLGTILVAKCPVWHPSVMFRKKSVMELGGFDSSYAPAEDFELWKRIALKRLNAAIVPRFHLLQRVHNRRQSLLQNDMQEYQMKRAHNETISSFSSCQDVNCLAAFLRLEKDPCGEGYNKKHIREIIGSLNEMISNVKDKQKLSNDELTSLTNTIYRRLGFGVRYGISLTRLPSLIFYPLFFCLSPLLLPKVRVVLSRVYNKFNELYYRTDSF